VDKYLQEEVVKMLRDLRSHDLEDVTVNVQNNEDGTQRLSIDVVYKERNYEITKDGRFYY